MKLGTALVLAGSRGPDDPVAAFAGVTHKAMVEVGGKPMLARVVSALAAAGANRIVVAIERPELVEELRQAGAFPPDATVEAMPAAAGPSASVEAGLKACGTPLLVTTADHALLRPEWIHAFLAGIRPVADVAAAVARSETVMAAAPDTKRTFMRFSDGAFSGCNLFYVSRPAGERAVALWREVESLRKQPAKLIARLGPWSGLRYGLGLLPLSAALDRLGALADVRAVAVELPYGEAAIDVDKPADLELVRRMVG